MKHNRLLMDVTEWMIADPTRSPSDAVAKVIELLTLTGYRSLELATADLLSQFLGQAIDQSNFSQADVLPSSVGREHPTVFVTCMRKEQLLVFLDVEPEPEREPEPGTEEDQVERGLEAEADRNYMLEVDIFAPDNPSLHGAEEDLVEGLIRGLELAKPRDRLLISTVPAWRTRERLVKRLTMSEPVSNALFQRLRAPDERAILLGLKKRGALLDRDLHELAVPGITVERIRGTLEEVSDGEVRLVDRKFAIVCNKTHEIIFLLRSEEDIESARNLECPKCSAPIGDESVMAYFAVTEDLKTLLDKGRWLPLLVKDALVVAGVRAEGIFTEVRHGDDEIDVLAFHRGRVFVVEVKDRSINLNDAYKLSAKTSRIEGVAARAAALDADDVLLDTSVLLSSLRGDRTRSRLAITRDAFIPVVISTHDIAKDAKDLLRETKQGAQFLENCEPILGTFVHDLIDNVDADLLARRFSQLVSPDTADSVASLAARQVHLAFLLWRSSTP